MTEEEKAVQRFRSGHSKSPYVVHGAILGGNRTRTPSGSKYTDEHVCLGCKSLLDLKDDVFDSFVRAIHSLRSGRDIYSKPADIAYHDISKQNEFLVKSV